MAVDKRAHYPATPLTSLIGYLTPLRDELEFSASTRKIHRPEDQKLVEQGLDWL